MDASDIIIELEKQVKAADVNSGVVLGDDLYAELMRRKEITVETFSWMGTGAMPMPVSAYKKSHAVCRNPDIGPWDFHVGGNPVFHA